MKLSNNFHLEEFVHPEFIETLKNRARFLVCPKLIESCQSLRNKFGSITINDWHKGGSYKLSGLRPLHSDIGSTWSMHKTGHAADLKFSVPVEKVYYHVLNNQKNFPFITRMENIEHTPSWLHIESTGEERTGDIIIFNP